MSTSILLAAYAVCNVSLFLEPQDFVRDASWPTHAAIAAPQGWIKPDDRLVVQENGRPIVSQVEVVARWPDGSPKWLHAHASFRYVGGKPAAYTLSKSSKPPDEPPKTLLTVAGEPGGIAIDTGAAKIFIPRPFAGIWLTRGDRGSAGGMAGGPTLVDERGIRWHAMHDDKAEIVVEQQGPAQVTVKASGWYQTADKRVDPFCRFVTRISAFAGSPLVKIDHATIFADDMRKRAVAELSFKIPLAKVKGFSTTGSEGRLDDASSAVWFAQLTANRLLTVTPREPESIKGAKIKDTNARSEGWFCADAANERVALLTKDFWHKCPKEVGIERDGITYCAWPRHGELSKPSDAATRPENLYKFLCFQSGKLLDSRLPNEYFAALENQTDTTECKAEYARAANLEGAAIHDEFALLILSALSTSKAPSDQVARWQRLYEQSPIARVSPEAMAVSHALGPVAAAGKDFPEVQKAVREGMIGYARSIPRYGDYGWAIYGNTHSEELMNPQAAGVPGGRPSLHRVWNNNHYQHVSTSWRMFALNEDPRLLAWARACTDYYASIGQVRYDGHRGHRDGNDQPMPGPEVKYHNPGAFWHCKAFVPWGCRDFGMDRNDDDSGLTGHWPDPSGLLFAWLIDANRWAKDGYDLWLENVKFPTGGTRREINTTLVHAITAYEHNPKPEILSAIEGMARGLSSVPIMDQRPGPLWEPTWLSRYHELRPDDQAFNKYIIASADAVGTGVESVWSLALSATAYEMTKNENYLRRHAGTLARSVRQVFHDPAPDKRWEGYGFGPGPDRDRHFMLQWPRFNAALRTAKIESLEAPDEPGQYFCGAARFDNPPDVAARGTKILFWKEPSQGKVNFEAIPLSGGDIQATSLALLSPGGQAVVNVPRIPMSAAAPKIASSFRPSTWTAAAEQYPVPGNTPGMYTVLVGSNEIGVFQPLTPFPECQVLRNTKLKNWSDPASLLVKLTHGYLVPLTNSKIELTFYAAGDRDGSYLALNDSRGKAIVSQWIRAGESLAVILNGAGGSPGPWLLDAFSDHTGFLRLAITADVDEPLLYGRRLEDIQSIRKKLGK